MEFKDSGLFWAFIGAVCWEIFKQTLNLILKKSQDSQDAKVKLFREDLKDITELAYQIHQDALKYYSLIYNSDEAKLLSKQIKTTKTTVGMKLHTLNKLYAKTNGNKNFIDIKIWTEFKSATTGNLDMHRVGVWSENDERFSKIDKITLAFQYALNTARYSSSNYKF